MNEQFSNLYRCLLIENTGDWKEGDLDRNGGRFVSPTDSIPGSVRKLLDGLAQPKQFKVSEVISSPGHC